MATVCGGFSFVKTRSQNFAQQTNPVTLSLLLSFLARSPALLLCHSALIPPPAPPLLMGLPFRGYLCNAALLLSAPSPSAFGTRDDYIGGTRVEAVHKPQQLLHYQLLAEIAIADGVVSSQALRTRRHACARARTHTHTVIMLTPSRRRRALSNSVLRSGTCGRPRAASAVLAARAHRRGRGHTAPPERLKAERCSGAHARRAGAAVPGGHAGWRGPLDAAPRAAVQAWRRPTPRLP